MKIISKTMAIIGLFTVAATGLPVTEMAQAQSYRSRDGDGLSHRDVRRARAVRANRGVSRHDVRRARAIRADRGVSRRDVRRARAIRSRRY